MGTGQLGHHEPGIAETETPAHSDVDVLKN
jgi:hypothetical protein